MGLNANKSGGDKKFAPQKNIEPGVYPARLVQLIDLGLQAQNPYQGKDKAPVQEIMLTYELVDEFMRDDDGEPIPDKPRWISETLPFYGLFAEKAKSTMRYNAFDPKGEFNGDFSKAVGMPINVAVVNNASGDKVYDNVGNVSTMRPKDAEKCPALVNPSKVFDLDTPDMDVFNKLPKWIQDKIKSNLNFSGSVLSIALGGKPDPKQNTKGEDFDHPKAEPEDLDNTNPY